MELSLMTVFWLMLAGVITGASKFSVGGMGLIILPVLMTAIPNKSALGVIVLMYLVTDVMAVGTYRKSVNWQVIYQVLPMALVGIIIGLLVLKHIDNKTFVLMLLALIVIMLCISFVLERHPIDISRYPAIAYTIGLISGAVSMLGNAAGPIFSLYMLAVAGHDKQSYTGTRAWIFLLINSAKGIGLVWIGLANWQTAYMSLYTLPGVLLGAFLGYSLLKKIDVRFFKILVRVLVIVAAARLLLLYLQL